MDPKLRQHNTAVPAKEKIGNTTIASPVEKIGNTTIVSNGEKVGNTTQSLYLPARVLFEDETGEIIQEIARTTYISANRATIPLRRSLQIGMVIRAAVPLPPSWRKHSFTDAVYITPAEVMSVRQENDFFVTNLNFLSDKDAMRRRKEYEAKKRTIEMSAKVEKPNRRNDSRLEIPVELTLEVLNDFGNVIASETTVTENISKGGARLMTSQEVRCGDIVHVKAVREDFDTKAVVKNTYMSADRVRRINIQFMDTEWHI